MAKKRTQESGRSKRRVLILRGTPQERVAAIRSHFAKSEGTRSVPVGFPPRLETVPNVSTLQIRAILEELGRVADRDWKPIGQRPGPFDQSIDTMKKEELEGDKAYAGIRFYYETWKPKRQRLDLLAKENRITDADLGSFWSLVHDLGFWLAEHQKHESGLLTSTHRSHPKLEDRWTIALIGPARKQAPATKPRATKRSPKPATPSAPASPTPLPPPLPPLPAPPSPPKRERKPQPKPAPAPPTTPPRKPPTSTRTSSSFVPLLMVGALAYLLTR